MRRRLLLSTPLSLFVARHARADTQLLPVTASFTILADMVRQVGGDRVEVASLVGPGGDVHTFQPRPSDLGRLAAAGVMVENGLALEGWMTRLVSSSGFHGRRITAAAGLPTRRFQEDGRTVTDPHVWQDPRLAVRMVAAIADGLVAADPASADAYRFRAQAFSDAIRQQDMAIEQAVNAIPAPKRQIITSHDAFGYYGARYGITFRAAQGISTEAEPTPRDLARLVAQIRRDHVRAIFVETMTDPRIAESLAREAGAVVGGQVYSDSLSPPDGPAPTYLAMLRHNTRLFTAAMAAQ
jgi:zinc/manganese transport system substrate-binding protein